LLLVVVLVYPSEPLEGKLRTSRVTFWSSLKSARMKLWDEELQRMVGFPKRARLIALFY